MRTPNRFATWSLVALLSLGVVACSDDPGEDELGDGEVNDAGD